MIATCSGSPEAKAPSPAEAASELLRRRAARRSLLDFTTYTKPDYEAGWHHRLLCRFLDRFARGEITRGVINMPPQHGKSELASRRLPAYLLGQNPDLRLICCSHTQDLASAMNRDVQRVMTSPEYGRLFPSVRLSEGNVRTAAGAPLRNSEMFEVLGGKGYYKAAGVGGSIVGRGFDVGIIDDPVKKREEADSPTCREGVWGWYTGDFLTRRGKGARILVITTRWHEGDLVGRLKDAQEADPKADRWEVLTLPAVNEHGPNEHDPRAPGEALWVERYPVEDLEKVKAASPYEYASQYQQHPRAQGSTEWPDEHFGPGIWFDDWPPGMLFRVLALDPSKGRDSKHGDYSAYVVAGIDATGTLWVEADLERRPVSQIVEDGLELYRCHQPKAWAVEVNQFQSLLATEIKRLAGERRMGVLPLFGITNTEPKVVRIRRLGPYLAQGKLRFKANSPGTRLLVQQLREFPSGAFDDGPDGLEMCERMIKHLLQGKRSDQRGQPELVR